MNISADETHVSLYDPNQNIYFWRPLTERDSKDLAGGKTKRFEKRMKKLCYYYRAKYKDVK